MRRDINGLTCGQCGGSGIGWEVTTAYREFDPYDTPWVWRLWEDGQWLRSGRALTRIECVSEARYVKEVIIKRRVGRGVKVTVL